MVAVRGPVEADCARKCESVDFRAAAERIPLALHDQRWTRECCKMGGAQFPGFVGRMERIAQANEAADAARPVKLIGDEARYPTAH